MTDPRDDRRDLTEDVAGQENPDSRPQPGHIRVHDANTPGEGAGEAAEAEVEPTPEQIAEWRRKAGERDDLGKKLLRVAADFANSQKRIEREAQTRVAYAVQDFVREILAVTDSLERALNAAEESHDLAGFIEGIRLVDKQFHDILSRHDVEPIPAVRGETFDPNLHEVVAMVPSADFAPHAILAEVERGFQLRDRVIRPAKVIVAAPPQEDAQGAAEPGGEPDDEA